MENKNWIYWIVVLIVIGVAITVGLSNGLFTKQSNGPTSSTTIVDQDIPDIGGYGWIYDKANLIEDNEEENLAIKLSSFAKSDKGEIAVLTVDSLNGLSIEEFGIRVGEKFKVGKQGKDDGVIIIISSGDRKVRIEVGRGASVTDAQAGKVLDNIMVPKLKAGDWSGAVEDGVNALINLTNK